MGKEISNYTQSITEIVANLQRQEQDAYKREEVERQKRTDESMRVMGDLGVTQIFEDLKDSEKLAFFRQTKTETHKGLFGIVTEKTYINKVYQARIEYSSRIVSASILFDAKSCLNRHCDTVLRDPCIVYVEKKDNNIFIGWNETEYSRNYSRALKTQTKDEISTLIGQAIYYANPNVQFLNPPPIIERFRRK